MGTDLTLHLLTCRPRRIHQRGYDRVRARGCHRGHRPSSEVASPNAALPASCNAPSFTRCDAPGITVRCLIVDDNPHFLRAARTLLEREGLAVVGTATSGSECLERAVALQPDVVLLDIDLGDESGFDLANDLARHHASAAIIFISTHEGPEYSDLATGSGGVGFLPKSTLSKAAIEGLLAGVSRRA